MIRLGIDLGGTKIEIIALAEDGQELLRKRVPTPRNDYRRTLKVIATLITDVENQLDAQGSIGIGTPGAISPATGLLRNCNSVCLNDRPFKYDLEKLLNRSVQMDNDANCFALSEAIDGAAQGFDVVFGVIIGTGTGGGVVVNGRVLNGPNAIAGEWGHNPIPWPTQQELLNHPCFCGKSSCIETFLCGPALEQDHLTVTGCRQSVAEIVENALAGDVLAELTLTRYEERMAKSLAHVINILDPNVIVLGGGLSNISRLYSNVPRFWKDYVLSDSVNTKLVAPKYGDSSGVRGAAWLWN